jgi:hypothetical protein
MVSCVPGAIVCGLHEAEYEFERKGTRKPAEISHFFSLNIQ